MTKELRLIKTLMTGCKLLQRCSHSTVTCLHSHRSCHTASQAETPPSQGYNFDLTEEQREIRDLAQRFAREEVLPVAAKYDKSGDFPWDLFKRTWELGLLHPVIPTEYGGAGLGVFDEVMILEEIAYACAAVHTTVGASTLGLWPMLLKGSDKLKKKYLTRFAEEPTCAAYAVTEPSGGSDVSGVKTKAVKQGNEWILNGNKMWITNAGVASIYYVLARTDPNPKANTGGAFTGFIVEKDWPGVSVSEKLWNIGIRCSDTRGITFEDVRVPEENVVGQEGLGFKTAMGTFDRTRPYASAGAIGVAQRALDEAAKYSMERVTFGKPIAQHQMITGMIADMAARVEAARLVNQKAAVEIDKGRRNTYYASIAKLLAGLAANQNTQDALQIYGSYGFNTEYPIEKLLRDAKIYSIYEGTEQIQKLIIGREYLQKMQS